MANELKLYLPVVLQDIAEYEALSKAETPILQDIEAKTNQIVEDSFLTTMSEERLAEWETALGISPTTESISQRRSIVLSRFRGTGKLNKTLILAMVNAFTGGSGTVAMENGVIKVRVAPPTSTFVGFSAEKLTNELSKRKPAHLLLNVELAYITWNEIKNNFSNWEDVRDNFNSWYDIYYYYTAMEGYGLWH